MIIYVPSVGALCPRCGAMGSVDLPEPMPALPLWTHCAGPKGCGHPYKIAHLTVTAHLEPLDTEPTLSTSADTEA